MEELHFTEEVYCKGCDWEPKGNKEMFFWERFGRWKKRKPMPKEIQEIIMNKLGKLIEFRVDGIMNSNKRNYYDECASFVAALGEVKESCGDTLGKTRTLNEYRMKYSRRRAFHQELERFR